MKTLKTLLFIAIAIIGFSATSFGQSSATATATATMVTPINISKTADMNFGTLGASGTAGTVELTPAGARTPSVGVKAIGSGQTAAAFTVTGEGTSSFSITLPSSVTITNQTGSGAETMTVNAFTSTPSGTSSLADGTKAITVGATLNIDANQVAGTYLSETPFTVTVNYN